MQLSVCSSQITAVGGRALQHVTQTLPTRAALFVLYGEAWHILRRLAFNPFAAEGLAARERQLEAESINTPIAASAD
jgi:hypothetical protein